MDKKSVFYTVKLANVSMNILKTSPEILVYLLITTRIEQFVTKNDQNGPENGKCLISSNN